MGHLRFGWLGQQYHRLVTLGQPDHRLGAAASALSSAHSGGGPHAGASAVGKLSQWR